MRLCGSSCWSGTSGWRGGGRTWDELWYGCASHYFETYPIHIPGLWKNKCWPIHILPFDFCTHLLLVVRQISQSYHWIPREHAASKNLWAKNMCINWDVSKVGPSQYHITKTCLFKYIENFTTKNWKFSDKISDIFHISAQNIVWGYSLELPRRGCSNENQQSMFLSRSKKNNVYPCKPQFYQIKLYRYVFVMNQEKPGVVYFAKRGIIIYLAALKKGGHSITFTTHIRTIPYIGSY